MLIILLILFTNISNSQEYYRVFYKDKDTISFQNNNFSYKETLKLYDVNALKRRGNLYIEDAIITPSYIEKLKEFDIEYINSSRWFNYSLIKADTSVIKEIEKLSFVKKVNRTNTKFSTLDVKSSELANYTEMILDKNSYGESENQVSQLGVDKLHKLGFNGDSVIVGYLDSGFRLFDDVVDSTHLLGQYDFVNNDNETSNEAGDAANQDLHGTCVLSTVSAYNQDSLIGMASESFFYLAKTENVSGKKNVEEDNFVFGLEWLETRGVQLINSSLGYRIFDDGELSHSFSDLDGNTTLVSQAVNKAVKRKIMFFNAIGNDGPGEKTLISPSDANSVIAIGGLKKGSEEIANFSSIGPNASSDIRPHFVAQAADVSIASNNPNKKFIKGNGTSFASPLMMGATTLIKSAYPEATNYNIFNSMKVAANVPNGDEPSNTFGYGIVNFKNLMDTLSYNYGPAIAPYNTFEIGGKLRIVIYVLSVYDCDVNIKYIENGEEVIKTMEKGGEEYQYYFDLEKNLFIDNNALVNFSVTDSKKRVKKYSNNYFEIKWGKEIIRKGVDKFGMPTLVSDNKEDIIPILYSDRLEIINNSEKNELFEINILDINGKFLFLNSILIQQQKNVLYLENQLNLGLYFVVLKNSTGIKTYKLILN